MLRMTQQAAWRWASVLLAPQRGGVRGIAPAQAAHGPPANEVCVSALLLALLFMTALAIPFFSVRTRSCRSFYKLH